MTANHRLQSLIKAIGFITLYIVSGAILKQFKPLFPPEFERYTQGILGSIGVLLTVFVFMKFVKKTSQDYGLIWEKRTLKRFGIGLLGGLLIAFVLMMSQVHFSKLELTFNDDIELHHFFFWSLAFIPLAFMEEIAFRSYPLIKLNKAFGLRTSQFILAVLFAVYHMLMMWGVKTSLLGPGVWSLAYVLTALASGGIAVPTGLHFGLNFVQSIIGGQKGIEALWNVDYPSNASATAVAANENFGLALQILVLVILIIATEIYIRKKKKEPDNVYISSTNSN